MEPGWPPGLVGDSRRLVEVTCKCHSPQAPTSLHPWEPVLLPMLLGQAQPLGMWFNGEIICMENCVFECLRPHTCGSAPNWQKNHPSLRTMLWRLPGAAGWNQQPMAAWCCTCMAWGWGWHCLLRELPESLKRSPPPLHPVSKLLGSGLEEPWGPIQHRWAATNHPGTPGRCWEMPGDALSC